MNAFDIIGPIMIGPSSSHTAGACRIGNFARIIFESLPREVTLYFSGSFAKTYKGHGTDKAVVAGLLGFSASDERLRDSLKIANEMGMNVTIKCEELELAHPNTVRIVANRTSIGEQTSRGEQNFMGEQNCRGELCEPGNNIMEVIGSSVGGGNILITKINGVPVEVDGLYDTLIINHKDIPGMITKISKALSDRNINVNGMKLSRSEKGGEAVVVVQVDNNIDDMAIFDEFKNLQDVSKVTYLKALKPL
jgi:L-serine dehydratase